MNAEEQRIRQECAKIASIESHYWAMAQDERIQEISIGAMGACANISVAILLGKTAEQYQIEMEARDARRKD